MKLQFNNKLFDLEASTRLARRWTGTVCHFEDLYISPKGNHFVVYEWQPMPGLPFQERVIQEQLTSEQVRAFMLKCDEHVELLKKHFNETLEDA
jgi:hypothetical protein